MLVNFFPPFLFLHVSLSLFMSLRFSVTLSLPLSRSATLSDSVCFYVSISAILRRSLSASVSLTISLLCASYSLLPSLSLSSLLFHLVLSELCQEKIQRLAPRSREVEKQYCHTGQLWFRTIAIPWDLFPCLIPHPLKHFGHIISMHLGQHPRRDLQSSLFHMKKLRTGEEEVPFKSTQQIYLRFKIEMNILK